MIYRITYRYFDGDTYRQSQCEKPFEEDNDDDAVKLFRQFQEDEERLNGLVSGNSNYKLERVEPDGTLTKIV